MHYIFFVFCFFLSLVVLYGKEKEKPKDRKYIEFIEEHGYYVGWFIYFMSYVLGGEAVYWFWFILFK